VLLGAVQVDTGQVSTGLIRKLRLMNIQKMLKLFNRLDTKVKTKVTSRKFIFKQSIILFVTFFGAFTSIFSLAADDVENIDISVSESKKDDPIYSQIHDEDILRMVLLAEEEKLIEEKERIFFGNKETNKEEEEEIDFSSLTDKELEALFLKKLEENEDFGFYRLRIGDKLRISIYGESGTTRTVSVDQTGNINYLLIGTVYALGNTINELRDELNIKIQKFFKYTFTTITPTQFGSEYYTILGEVGKPGKKIIRGRTRALEAIGYAGGLRSGSYRSQTVDLADLSHAFLAREGTYIPIDFRALVNNGDVTENIDILDGDYIYIPNSLYREIYILGEVNAPTTIGFINTVSVVEAIAQGRGLTALASSRAVVIRGSLSRPEKYLIDINLILRGFEPDFLLEPGDILYVPPRQFTNFRDLVKLGIRSFIGSIGGSAGTSAFLATHPHAQGTTSAPVLTLPVIAP
jgi:protein involved in polysaccharide export with SLBB domain